MSRSAETGSSAICISFGADVYNSFCGLASEDGGDDDDTGSLKGDDEEVATPPPPPVVEVAPAKSVVRRIAKK
jgi:hypothetical protein